MDGTLLDGEGEIPVGFWPLLEEMRSRGIVFVPASGRQLATLEQLFAHAGTGGSYVAENGTLVVHEGEVVSTTVVDHATVQDVIVTTRRAVADPASSTDLGLVVCGVTSAYIERTDPAFRAEVDRYYVKLQVVDDLTTVTDQVLKLATFDFHDAETTANTLFAPYDTTHQVVTSGKHWIDIMSPDADKGRGIRALQKALGIKPSQTAVFGDYLNDLELMAAGDWSFAVANAHPDILAAARYMAPSNRDHGVLAVLQRLLGHEASGR